MSNQSASRAFRSRVGLDPIEGGDPVEEVDPIDFNDLDDTPADGPVPTTGGETQPPGTERGPDTNASDLDSPERTEPDVEKVEVGTAEHAVVPPEEVHDKHDGDPA